MDDLIIVVLDALFWLFILDFDKKGQATAKIVIWAAIIILGGIFVFTI